MTTLVKRGGRWGRLRFDLNPVVVKELRQAVRSWFVTGVLLLFLSVLLVTMLSFLASRSAGLTPDQGFGQDVFQVLTVILAGACLLFIPLYTGVRLAIERQETNLDLLYVTTLSPGRIIRGKLFCGIYLTLLFFSACLPFVVLTNLLRGVDIPTIAFVLGVIFACTAGAIQLAIFIACLPVSTLFKAFLALPTLGYLTALAGLVAAFSRDFLRSGFLSMRLWGIVATATIFLLAFGWLHLSSIALISPRAMNRSLPLRLFSTLVWLGSGIVLAWCAIKENQGGFMVSWLFFSLLLIILGLTVAVGQPDDYSLRVRRQIPRSPWLRAPAFFFYNGAAQGLAWMWVITLLTAMGFFTFHEFDLRWNAAALWNRSYASRYDLLLPLILALYAHAYALTGLFLRRTFFPHRPALWASVFAFLIPTAWAVLPNLFLFLVNRLTWAVVEKPQLGNALNLLINNDESQAWSHLWFAAGWVLLAAAANLPWFIRQIRAFKPMESSRTSLAP